MTEQGFLKPGWGRPELVAALSDCVAEWGRHLAAPAVRRDPTLYALLQLSRQLEAPCRSVGFGGVGHHLNELARMAEHAVDPAASREQLAIVRELLQSARSSLTPQEIAKAEATQRGHHEAAPAPVSVGPESLEPPPLLSGYIKAFTPPKSMPPAAPAPPAAAPPIVAIPVPGNPAAAPAPAPTGAPAPPRMVTSFGQRAVTPPPALSGSPPGSPERPLPGPSAPPNAPGNAPPAAPPLFNLPGAAPALAPTPQASHAPVPVVPGRPEQPNLMVRSVLGLRAFGKKDGAPSAPSVPPPAEPQAQPSMLGLQHRSSSASQPPPALGGGYGGLPALREPSSPPPALGLPGMLGQRPDYDETRDEGRDERATGPRRSLQRTPAGLSSSAGRARSRSSANTRRRPEQGESRWWIGALAALGVCAVVLGIVLVAVMASRRRDDPPAVANAATGVASGAAPTSDGAAPTAAGSDLPKSRLLNDDERFRSLLAQVHGRGGKESPELRALLDEQASISAQALKPGCVGPQCKALAEVGKLVSSNGKRRVKRRSRSPDSLRSRWLAGLEMPEIPVEDDPRVQKRFEFYTENPLGRETFQQMLFRCGAYRDTIQSALIRRGLPKDLIAVAYAESGCYPLAKSPVGAEGLWQFIPDAARAYHLRIIDGIVDERHSPQKSTEAAIQYFSDMYAKFGEWDLVFSAYNMGPWGLAARLERVEGEHVGFWELVDAEMLPGETADYAPAIQAIALILNNLQKLKFGAIQQRAPQMTMDLQVPPNTRLSLVARAAALSVDELHRLNLDIDGNATPNVPNFAVQVPKDSVWQARDTLQELLKAKDDSDLCAPNNFDWGRQRFTPEMQEACNRNLATRSAAPAASALAAPARVP